MEVGAIATLLEGHMVGRGSAAAGASEEVSARDMAVAAGTEEDLDGAVRIRPREPGMGDPIMGLLTR